MGDFHGTCFASSLPIFAGEDCAAILMVKNPYSSTNNTYTNGRYFPITAPIRGKYDGCGGIIPLCDSNFETLEAFVLEKSALLYAKEPVLSCEREILSVPNLSDALNYAVRRELFLNGKAFPRNGNRAVEIGLLHGGILTFAETEYHRHQQYAEDMLHKLFASVKKEGPLSPRILQREENLRYAIFDNGLVDAFLMCAIRHGYNPASLAAAAHMLQNHRLRFIPGSGAGGQSGVESKQQLAYYQMISQLAEDIFDRASSY